MIIMRRYIREERVTPVTRILGEVVLYMAYLSTEIILPTIHEMRAFVNAGVVRGRKRL
jgi:hypothetical protein